MMTPLRILVDHPPAVGAGDQIRLVVIVDVGGIRQLAIVVFLLDILLSHATKIRFNPHNTNVTPDFLPCICPRRPININGAACRLLLDLGLSLFMHRLP